MPLILDKSVFDEQGRDTGHTAGYHVIRMYQHFPQEKRVFITLSGYKDKSTFLNNGGVSVSYSFQFLGTESIPEPKSANESELAIKTTSGGWEAAVIE